MLRTTSKPRHVPGFLIEVTSPSDKLEHQKRKCVEWIEAGVQEVVLLHPPEKTVWVFRSNGSIEEIREAKQVISRSLNGFILDCSPIWEEISE